MIYYSQRPIVIYDLPLPKYVHLLHPEMAIIKVGNASYDVGALCYIRRENTNRNSTTIGQEVDLGSFSEERANSVRLLINCFSDQVANGHKRDRTLQTEFSNFINGFMYWVDTNGHTDVLENFEAAQLAFTQYVFHLKDQVSKLVFNNNTAAHKQADILTILSDFMDRDDLARGVNLIGTSLSEQEPTAPPDAIEMAKVLSLCDSLFSGLSSLVLNTEPFPYFLKMPKYLGFDNDGFWVFPINAWCDPLGRMKGKDKTHCRVYDYGNGTLRELSEVLHLYANYDNAVRSVRGAEQNLLEANANQFHFRRRSSASLAVGAFLLMFFANTGMNLAQALELTWDDDFEVGVERQGFRAIKWRARGRGCSFEISTQFLHTFKQYLKLRDYLLSDENCDLLFFTSGLNKGDKPHKMGASVLTEFYRTLKSIDPDISTLLSKKMRAAKSDWLVKNTDIATAAKILNNTERTILKSYAAGSETTHIEEMSAFLNSVADVVLAKDAAVDHGVDLPVGICASFGDPHQVAKDIPSQPDCRSPEGCLFCDKFKIHADERDTRKLLSCQYCLQETAHMVSSEEQYSTLFVPIFNRIQQLLSEIGQRDLAMVERVQQEVSEGELDPFWVSKLEMLINLELI